jgi:hypothetical protein
MRVADPVVADPAASWKAELSLGFEFTDGRTVLARKQHDGPLVVQKALYPEGGEVCHAIIVHPPAGIAGGDELALNVQSGKAAAALLTTPGAGKWYRTSGPWAAQRLVFDVEGTLEWLPQETIVFDGARADLRPRCASAASTLRRLGRSSASGAAAPASAAAPSAEHENFQEQQDDLAGARPDRRGEADAIAGRPGRAYRLRHFCGRAWRLARCCPPPASSPASRGCPACWSRASRRLERGSEQAFAALWTALRPGSAARRTSRASGEPEENLRSSLRAKRTSC